MVLQLCKEEVWRKCGSDGVGDGAVLCGDVYLQHGLFAVGVFNVRRRVTLF